MGFKDRLREKREANLTQAALAESLCYCEDNSNTSWAVESQQNMKS